MDKIFLFTVIGVIAVIVYDIAKTNTEIVQKMEWQIGQLNRQNEVLERQLQIILQLFNRIDEHLPLEEPFEDK